MTKSELRAQSVQLARRTDALLRLWNGTARECRSASAPVEMTVTGYKGPNPMPKKLAEAFAALGEAARIHALAEIGRRIVTGTSVRKRSTPHARRCVSRRRRSEGCRTYSTV
jgi:hypothetical protein